MADHRISWHFGGEESESSCWGWPVVCNLKRQPQAALLPRLMCSECHRSGLLVLSRPHRALSSMPFTLPVLQAYVVLGQFLVLKKDEDLFREWLKDTCGANAKQSRDCFGCLREWCDAFL